MSGLFGWKGRVSRLGYWRLYLRLVILWMTAWCIGLVANITFGPWGAVAYLPLAPLLLGLIALHVRRLHDRNFGGLWLVLFLLGPWLLLAIAQQLMVSKAPGSVLAGLLATLLSLGVNIWGLIEIWFRRGTPGPNQYGEDSMAHGAA